MSLAEQAQVSAASLWCHCDMEKLHQIYGSGFSFSENYQEIATLLGDFHSFLSYNPEVFRLPEHGYNGSRPGEQAYALDGGSLIGWERHKSVIPYDTDADVLAPKSFFINLAKYAVMKGLGKDNVLWITLPLVRDGISLVDDAHGASARSSKRVAIIYGTRKIRSVDDIFRRANVTHVIALSNHVYRKFAGGSPDVFTKGNGDEEVSLRKDAHGTNVVEWLHPWDGVIAARFFMRHEKPTRESFILESSPNTTTAQLTPWDHGADAYTQIDVFPYKGVSDCVTDWPMIVSNLRQDEDFPPTEIVGLNNVHVRVFSKQSDRHLRLNTCYSHNEPVIEHPDKMWDNKVQHWVASIPQAAPKAAEATKSTSQTAADDMTWKWGHQQAYRAVAYARTIRDWVSHVWR